MSQRLINFYSQYFGDLRYNSLGECSVNCCFHDDQQASMSVNVNTGLWYCFRCDAADGLRGGDEYDFYKEIKRREGINLRFNQIKAQVDAMVGPRTEEETQAREQERGEQNGTIERPVQYVDDGKVQQWRMMLDRNPNVKAYLLNKRGLTEETLSRFDIGWDIERVTIPIPDRERRWVNIRRYSASARNGVKMMSYRTGYGDATLFPIQNLDNDIILLNEGEMDCLLANQLGYKAITVTGGASTWNDSWNELFTGKTVYICYDIDRAGKYGARKIAQKLAPYTNLLKVVHLPINDPPDGDFTDYIVGLGHSKEDFDRLLDETPVFNPNQEDNSSAGESHLVHLSQASNSEYNGRRVRFQVIVAGKDTSPYIVPKKLLIECQMDNRGCDNCLVGISGGRHRLNIRPDNPKIIQLLDCTVSQQRGIIRAMAGIPKGCTSFHLDEEESQNVDQLLLIPELDFGDDEEKYVLRKAYHVYDDGISLMANNSYVMSGLTVPDPRNQYSIHIVDSVEVSHDNISSFEMTPEKFERLKIFQSDDVHSKFEEIHKDFVYNITHIYGRNDLLTAVDLTYHSALSFDFMGKQVPKGQIECLILGDTRTGKSETVQGMMGHFRLGEFITGENVSFAGLVGGLEQNGKRMIMRWGKWPLSDKRLVVMDEVSGMHPEIIGNMSGVRTSGIAEINKIGIQQKTSARVRAIWLSNPRSGKPLAEYDYGTDAVLELIGNSEDVARFDFAMTCASSEVDSTLINRIHEHGTVPHVYTFDLCQDLVLWGWSRKKNQIHFEQEAVEIILEYANRMGRVYTSKVPLVEAANQRIKLAKLAVAAAIRLFSTPDGENVIVKPSHVHFVKEYLDEIYRKASLGYFNQSLTVRRQEQLAQQSKAKVMQFLDRNPGACNFFLNNSIFSARNMEELLDLDRPSTRRYLKFLNKCGMIKQTSAGYRKSPHFIEFLREWMNNNVTSVQQAREMPHDEEGD